MAKEAKDDKRKGIKRSAKVSPDVPKSEAHAMKLKYGLLATKGSIEVEEIEKKARIRFIRMRPRFEESISKSVDERLQDGHALLTLRRALLVLELRTRQRRAVRVFRLDRPLGLGRWTPIP